MTHVSPRTHTLCARSAALFAFASLFALWSACGPQGDEPAPDPGTVVAGDSDSANGGGGSGGGSGDTTDTGTDPGTDTGDDGSSGNVALGPPQLTVTPSTLDFGLSLSELAFGVRNAGGGVLVYSLTSDVPWATPLTLSGSSSGEADSVTIRVSRSGLAAGVYQGSVRVATVDQSISVALNMYVSDGTGGPALLEVTPTTLDFGTTLSVKYLSLRIANAGQSTFAVTSDVPWLTVAPSSGDNHGEWDILAVQLNRGALPAGVSSGTLSISTSAGFGAEVGVFADADSGSATVIHTITGRVKVLNTGVPNVTVSASEGGGSAVTDPNGFFSINVPEGWYGTVTPVHLNYMMTPTNRVYAGITSPLVAQDFGAATLATNPPDLVVHFTDGTYRNYSDKLVHEDDRLKATIQQVGEQRWLLTLNNKGVEIDEVWFPWDNWPYALNADLNDDVLFTPVFAGIARLPLLLQNFGWAGDKYPGTAFAPLTVICDNARARIIAATNWPPQTVTPMYSLQRQSLLYRDRLLPNQSRTFGALIAEVDGLASAGLHPWQLAADKYSAWLRETLVANNAQHNPAPWFRAANGWMHVGLMSMDTFVPSRIDLLWSQYGDKFPWFQMWGQMSNYTGDPSIAVPPLAPGEEVGCCLAQRPLHPRYIPELVPLVDRIRNEGGAVGLYTRPRTFGDEEGLWDDPNVVDGETNLQWYLGWIAMNKNERHANAFYLDVIGREYMGPPPLVLSAFQQGIPQENVVEGMIDIYPSGYLLSGYLRGLPIGGGPGKELENLGNGFSEASIPRFGRYVLGDRVAFLGESNNDYLLWGPANNHYGERQVFLLGCKFDVTNPWIDPHDPLVMNPAVEATLNVWTASGWWARNPVYRDRLGITNLPLGIDARHFVDKDGVHLLAIDNWSQLSGRQFKFYGQTVNVPTSRLSVLELGAFAN